MESLSFFLVLLISVVVSAGIQQVLPKLPSAFVQIGIGVVASLLSFGELDVALNSEIFLVLFIAPLIYNEAYNFNIASLWKKSGIILSFAIGLVITLTLVVGFTVNALYQAIPLAAALSLGAALSPTDAVAVTNISKKFKIKKSITDILCGEALFNDASGLVAFQFAILLATTGVFSASYAAEYFVFSFVVGIVTGLLFGLLFNTIKMWIESVGYEETPFYVIFSMTKPFIVFMFAEHIGVSGIIAVVVCGLVCGRKKRTNGPTMSRSNILTNNTWEVLTFTLNCIVFVLLGMQLPSIFFMDYSINYKINLLLIVLVVLVVMVVMRFAWSAITCIVSKQEHKLKSSILMTLLGAKGTMTLSIMFTIPQVIMLPDGSFGEFPARNELMFISASIILGSLILATFVAPLFAEKEDKSYDTNDVEANLDILRYVVEDLTNRQQAGNHMAIRQVIVAYNDRIDRIKKQNDIIYSKEHEKLARINAINWQINYIESEEVSNKYDKDVIENVLESLRETKSLLVSDSSLSSELLLSIKNLTRNFKSYFYKALNITPLINPTMTTESKYELIGESYIYAIGKLNESITNGDVDAEYIANVVADYQKQHKAIQSKMPSLSNMIKIDNKADDIELLALKLEMKYINKFLEEGKLSKEYAREMKNDVKLMEIDLM